MTTHSSSTRAVLGAAAVLLALGGAEAQPLPPAPALAAEVPLTREAPFDKWCVAPLCARAEHRLAVVKVPTTLPVNPALGLLEERLRNALVDALRKAAGPAFEAAHSRAVADLADALALALAATSPANALSGGLGGAVLRAGLTFRLDQSLPGEPACTGRARLDAVYEGLALSVAFAPLAFPKKRSRVLTPCKPTALRVARHVDEAALALVVSDAEREALVAAMQALAEMRKSCAELPGAAESALGKASDATPRTVRKLVQTLRDTRNAAAAPPPAPPTPDATAPARDAAPAPAVAPACEQAATALRAFDPALLDGLSAQGLGDVEPEALVASFQAPPVDAVALVAKLGQGTLGPDELTKLARELVQAAGLPTDLPVLKDGIAAMPSAVTLVEGVPTVDPKLVLQALQERYGLDDEGRPSLRTLLGLRTTPWIFELNGGIPEADFAEEKVVADLSFGYATGTFGGVGRGYVDTYTIDDDASHNDYTHTGGSLEGFWISGDKAAKLRLELRVAGAFEYYDTTTFPKENALDNFFDYDSRMGRGTGFAGLRYGTPTDRLSLMFLAGGGFQYEDPDTLTYTSGQTVRLVSEQNVTGQASGRLLVRVSAVPQILGLRLRADSTYFMITRESLTASGGPGNVTTTAVSEQQQQLDLHARLFLDADIAMFAGFVPALFGGLDYLGVQGSVTSTSELIPVLGVGIVRKSW